MPAASAAPIRSGALIRCSAAASRARSSRSVNGWPDVEEDIEDDGGNDIGDDMGLSLPFTGQ